MWWVPAGIGALVGWEVGRGRRAKSYNRRVSSCISGKVRGEGWSQRQAVAACLSMDREKRLRADGSYIRKGQRGKGKKLTWVGARDYPYQGARHYMMSYYAEVPGGTIGYGKDGHGGTITVWMSRGGEYSLDKTRDGFAFSRVTSYPQQGQPYFGSHRFKTGTEARKAAEAAWAKMQRRSR